MSFFQIAIADDNIGEAKTLQSFTEQCFAEQGHSIKIEVFTSGAELVEQFRPTYDLIFLDVEMKPMDGIATAKEIRLSDREVPIIYTTSFAKYAVQSYEVNAFDYLLKPVTYPAFQARIQRFLLSAARNKDHFIVLRVNRNMIKINTRDVQYIETAGHSVDYHCVGNVQYRIKRTLLNAEDELADPTFVRCNSGILVNMRHITGMEDDYFLVADQKLPISRNRKKECLTALAKFMGER